MLKLTLSLAILIAVCFSAEARNQRSRLLSGYGSVEQPIQPIQPVQQVFRLREEQPKQQYGGYGSGMEVRRGLGITLGSSCGQEEVGKKVVDSSSSNRFFVCTEAGVWELITCPSLTVFSSLTLKCENTIKTPKGCLSNPCQNNGKCVDLPLFQWRCDCLTGFSGDFCETTDGCDFDSFKQDGSICIPLPANSPVSKYYICDANLQTYGLDCKTSFETNPCLSNDADLKSFATKANSAFFVHCEGHIPHLKFCPYPLIYNHFLQQCDWTDEQIQVLPPLTSEQPSGSYSYGSQQIKIQSPQPIPQPAQQEYGYGAEIKKPVLRLSVPAQQQRYGNEFEVKPQLPMPEPTPLPVPQPMPIPEPQPIPQPIPQPAQQQYGYGAEIKKPSLRLPVPAQQRYGNEFEVKPQLSMPEPAPLPAPVPFPQPISQGYGYGSEIKKQIIRQPMPVPTPSFQPSYGSSSFRQPVQRQFVQQQRIVASNGGY